MLILASASSARRQLLENAGLKFKVLPADIDERALEQHGHISKSDPRDHPRGLAEAKAKSVSATHPGALVIGADQTLIHNAKHLHKPENLQAAKVQLQLLRGKTHYLYSAATLVRDGKTLWSHTGSAKLTMRQFSDAELRAVMDEEGPALLDSVGAYRLEGTSIRLFEAIEGDYFTILGLPLLALLQGLRQQGIAT